MQRRDQAGNALIWRNSQRFKEQLDVVGRGQTVVSDNKIKKLVDLRVGSNERDNVWLRLPFAGKPYLSYLAQCENRGYSSTATAAQVPNAAQASARMSDRKPGQAIG